MALMPKMTPKAQTYPTIAQVKGLKKFMINQPVVRKMVFYYQYKSGEWQLLLTEGKKTILATFTVMLFLMVENLRLKGQMGC